ncbi:MAG TPA: Vms1/Ankzf1 family peptidyl-tRNA hydrolase [Solirubrobacteraceae bacterium]|nr:Vms1/Ankzf1 family peptidyl-tRNA hydrolase [Solirubrobacteraceae bacterium]
MSVTSSTARRLLEHTGQHPVVSLYLDLDPSQFATAPARATQMRSLLDEAERNGHGMTASMSHADRTALDADLQRLEDYLGSDELPVSGAGALAVFCSGQDDLFEAVALADPTPPRAVIATSPFVEPLVSGPDEGQAAVVLISRRLGRILIGDPHDLREAEDVADRVHGKHSRGGWSQANYERSIDNDAEQHFRHVAEELYHGWQREPFERLVLGGPVEDVKRFAEDLHNDLRRLLLDERLDLDVEVARLADVGAALAPLLERARAAGKAAALEELENRLGAGGAAARGLAPTLEALNERRVQTLLLALNFSAPGTRCPRCGLLYPAQTGTCPADGEAVVEVADLREAAVEAAVLQDAGVMVIGEGTDPEPPALHRGGGIAALLRF